MKYCDCAYIWTQPFFLIIQASLALLFLHKNLVQSWDIETGVWEFLCAELPERLVFAVEGRTKQNEITISRNCQNNYFHMFFQFNKHQTGVIFT